MKLITLLGILAFSKAEKLDKTYLPPNAAASGGSDIILQAPVGGSILVVDNDDLQRQIAVTVGSDVETQTSIPIVTNVVDEQAQYVTSIVTESPVMQTSIGIATGGASQQSINDVVRIGNRGNNVFIKKPNVVVYKEVKYAGPRYQQVVEQRPERPQAASERHAAILRQEFKSEGDGYAYAYDTENGIYAEENGVATNGVNARGAFSYIGDDGVKYSMSYIADENGFQPEASYLPTPHPIPEEILKALEENARDEAAGIFDDGSYDAVKYGGIEGYHYSQPLGLLNVASSGSVVSTAGYPSASSAVAQGSTGENTVVVNNAALPTFGSTGYNYPAVLVNDKDNLGPVINTLFQEATPAKGYLPPVQRKTSAYPRIAKAARNPAVTKIRKQYKKNVNSS